MTHILVLTDSLSERAGGLSHGTLNLAKSTAELWPEANFSVAAQKDTSEIHLSGAFPNNLDIIKIPCFRNSIFPWSSELSKSVMKLEPDLIHLRGLWRQPSLVSLFWKKANPTKPLVVQTAGMLEPWARSRKRLVKSIYFSLTENKLLDCSSLLHATSQKEVQTLLNQGISPGKITLIEEGIYLPELKNLSCLPPSGKQKLLFLSRLHQVKGVELLLESLALLRPSNWICEIAGMGDENYVNELKKLASRLHLNNIVAFVGPLSGEVKSNALASADAFILPSFSESFGIAIAEAMSWALPVITTTKTPWDVLESEQMGWWVRPNLNEITKALFELFKTSKSDLLSMGLRSREYVSRRYEWSIIGQKMIDTYKILLDVDS